MFSQKWVKNRPGVTLVELMIGVTIILMVVIPLVNVLYRNLQGAMRFGDANKALQLAQELMEEIKQKKWDENEPAGGGATTIFSAIGTDIGETAPDADGSNGAKVTWDDIDDYHGLIEIPPRDVTNAINQNALKFKREVQVRYVSIPDTTALAAPVATNQVSGAPGSTNFKEITVTVSWGQYSGNRPVEVRISSIRANIKRY